MDSQVQGYLEGNSESCNLKVSSQDRQVNEAEGRCGREAAEWTQRSLPLH